VIAEARRMIAACAALRPHEAGVLFCKAIELNRALRDYIDGDAKLRHVVRVVTSARMTYTKLTGRLP
jgi:hypothetical protein